MRAVVTRVSSASVAIAGETVGAIDKGYLVLLGVAPADTEETAHKLAEKICNLRVFTDENGKMNLNLEQPVHPLCRHLLPPPGVHRRGKARRSRPPL